MESDSMGHYGSKNTVTIVDTNEMKQLPWYNIWRVSYKTDGPNECGNGFFVRKKMRTSTKKVQDGLKMTVMHSRQGDSSK